MAESTLLEKIITYRNTHKESRVILGIVLAEISRDEELNSKLNTKDPRNPSDSDVIRIIKGIITDNNKCVATKELEDENLLLNLFLPTQLSKEEISDIITEQCFTSIGVCMAYFKANHEGLFEGKTVSGIYKLLSSKGI
jgi:uncharacterized protein YqeY